MQLSEECQQGESCETKMARLYLHQFHLIVKGHAWSEFWLLGWNEGGDEPLCLRIIEQGATVVPQVLACIGACVLVQEPNDMSCDTLATSAVFRGS